MSWQNKLIKFTVSVKYNENGKKEVKFPKGYTELDKTINYNPKSYAIQTGSKSGIIVLDLDKNKKDLIDGTDLLDYYTFDTFTVKSPSGGYHLYFLYDDNISSNSTNIFKINNKLVCADIRSNNGCIFGFGTEVEYYNGSKFEKREWKIIKDKDIIKMPDFLIEMIKTKNLDENFKPIIYKEEKKEIINKEDAYEQMDKKLSLIKKEHYVDYNTWLNIGFCIFNILGDNELWHKYSKISDKYNRDDLISKWKSFKNSRKEKLGWNFINSLIDSPILENINSIYSFKNYMFDKIEFENKYRKNPFTPKSEEYINYIKELQIEFGKFFISTTESGVDMTYFLREIVKKDTKYLKLEEVETRRAIKDFNINCNIFNPSYTIKCHLTTVDPAKNILYIDDNKIILNRYLKPIWHLKKLEEWISKGDKKIQNEVSDWLKYHFKSVICNDNEKDYLFLCNFIGNTLFNPHFFPRIAPILSSSETGTGKTGVIKKIFEKYLGHAYGLKDDSNFSGKGALSPLVGKTFCLLEEVDITKSIEYNKLKTLISEDEISYEQKFQNTITVPNYCKFVLTTNKNRAISCLESNERRFCEFKLRSHLTHKEGYFNVYNYDWQYFTYFFKDFVGQVTYNHKTEVNINNTKIMLANHEIFIRDYIIANYNSFDASEGFFWPPQEKILKIYEEMGGKLKKDLFITYMKDRNVFIDIARKQINGERKMRIKLQKKEDIISAFKHRNSGLDPCKDWLYCPCNNKAFYEKNEKKYCISCVGDVEPTAQIIEY